MLLTARLLPVLVAEISKPARQEEWAFIDVPPPPVQYTCHVAGASKPEGGKATVGAAVPLETPFRFDLSLLGPPHTHTLLQARGEGGGGQEGNSCGSASELV